MKPIVSIVEYDEHWPQEFARLAAPLRHALGDLALRIDHIGSTSVPGLAAKDRIDIQVTVAQLDDTVSRALVAIGYTERTGISADHRPPRATGPDSDWEKRLFAPPPGQRPTNLHVRIAGRANQRYALLFRDYLRTHPMAAEAYAELKRRLAPWMPDTATYADVKDPACDLIICAAEGWAATTGWAPGLSDDE
jgi:GrpB-like predicted nucleotidyltransferase (UPF0157 family)